ncbi:unnamed protein product [Staurois parvus]|uniref:Uncharacterized protein n=1 Tax=Staurois parvus TaxID=386267 RepID=A0ABN9GP40_9NEOB|nr:unnamed protein product [Staurois parvus]
MCLFRVSSHCCQVHTDSWPLPLYGLQFKLLTLRHSAMGPCTRLLLLLLFCPGPECVMGPLYGLPFAADFIARLCHVPLSGLLTLLVGSIL